MIFYVMMECVANIADSCLFYVMLRPVCCPEQPKKNAFVTLFFFSVYSNILDNLKKGISISMLLGLMAAWFIWGLVKFKSKDIRMLIFQIVLAAVILLFAEGIPVSLLILFFNATNQIMSTATMVRVIAIILAKSLAYIYAFYLLRFLKNNTATRFLSVFHGILTIFILYMIIYYRLIENVANSDEVGRTIRVNNQIIMLCIGIFMLIIIYFFLKLMDRTKRINQILDIYFLQRKVLRQQKREIRNIRKKQHEYKNNIESIHALLSEEDVERARTLTKEFMRESQDMDSKIRKNSTFTQILIDYKMQEAARKHIDTSQSVHISYDVPISDSDIAVIVHNAVNNAIEACEKLPVSSRYIKCVVNMKMKYLNFYFENPCNETLSMKDGKLTTTKEQKEEHGIGIQNIEYVANKYNGLLSYHSQNGVFCLKCSLLVPEEKNVESAG